MSVIRNLPRWVAILIWAIGFTLVLIGELIAVGTSASGDTITEIVKWLIGFGKGFAWYYVAMRILIFGLLAWLMLHFSGRDV